MTNPRTSKLLGCYTLRMSGHGSCHPCSLLGNIMTPLNLLFHGLCKYDRLKTVLDSMGKTSNEPWTCMEDMQVSGLYIIYRTIKYMKWLYPYPENDHKPM